MKHTNLLFLGALLMALAGCASSPKPNLSKAEAAKIDWSERVGTYTFEEAVADLGRPAVLTESGDGRTAEWVLKRSPQMSFGFGVGGGSYGHHSGVGVGVGSTVSPPPRGEYLSLTFDRENTLKEWSKVNY